MKPSGRRARMSALDGRRAAIALSASGLALIALARVASPSAPPLYDGVVVQEPYRYVSPGPGQAGSPAAFTTTEQVSGGSSPAIAAATQESPPQAQLIAAAGAFTLAAGTTAMTVSITPVAPVANTPGLRGNIYRFRVADQAGHDLATAPGSTVTIVLRAPANVVDPQMITAQPAGGWSAVAGQAASGGFVDANVTRLGEFGLSGSLATASAASAPLIAVAAIVVLAAIGGLALVVWWRRSRPTSAPVAATRATPPPRSRPRRRPRR